MRGLGWTAADSDHVGDGHFAEVCHPELNEGDLYLTDAGELYLGLW